MLSRTSLYLLVLACVGSCIASPIKSSAVHCSPFESPTKLISYPHRNPMVYYVYSSSKSQQYELLTSNSTDEQFQFYTCSLPGDNYRKPTSTRKYGQVRSLKHPGMCITPDNNLVPPKKGSNADFDMVPSNTSGIINLAPCEKTDTEVMRRQWMLLDYPSADDKCKLPELKQAGRKGDLIAKDLFAWRGRVEFDYLTEVPVNPGYLHDHLPKSCTVQG